MGKNKNQDVPETANGDEGIENASTPAIAAETDESNTVEGAAAPDSAEANLSAPAGDTGNAAAGDVGTSTSTTPHSASIASTPDSIESSAELGSKTSDTGYSDDAKAQAESLLQEIEDFLKVAENEVMTVGSTLWHLISHLRDAKIHAKDVAGI